MKVKRLILIQIVLFALAFSYYAFEIYDYSFKFSEKKSDVAIVLGAGIDNGEPSPVFKERVNHAIYLYNRKTVSKIIFTGGIGEGQNIADSQAAKNYAIAQGVRDEDILIDVKSHYTFENLQESDSIMKMNGMSTALLVSDPLHMKRSMVLAQALDMKCESSPTQTSMYRSKSTRIKSLIYETIFYSIDKISFFH